MNNESTCSRRKTRPVFLHNTQVGGGAPVSVQSMTKTKSCDIAATGMEIARLALAGCDIIRLAVPDEHSTLGLAEIVRNSPIPVIADIHFDHMLALKAVEAGVHGLRINPGNLRSESKVREIVSAARNGKIPIRIGVNSGSLDPAIKGKYGGVTAEALAESALNEIAFLEKFGFFDIKIAVKAFDLFVLSRAVKIVAGACDYPIHLGVTESGLPEEGIVRSSIGIGHLLMSGIGDTIRISLTGDPVLEVSTGIEILRSTGLREAGPIIVSCPTCGRCQIPLFEIAQEVKRRISGMKASIKVAVMGCAVNGPGEASQADFGIAGGKEHGLLFCKGKIVASFPQSELVDALIAEIEDKIGLEDGFEKKV